MAEGDRYITTKFFGSRDDDGEPKPGSIPEGTEVTVIHEGSADEAGYGGDIIVQFTDPDTGTLRNWGVSDLNDGFNKQEG
jgi:hypothetical protein